MVKLKRYFLMVLFVAVGMICAFIYNHRRYSTAQVVAPSQWDQQNSELNLLSNRRPKGEARVGVTLSPAWEQFLERKKELQGHWSNTRTWAKKTFHFPQPHYSKTDTTLLHSPWTEQLRSILKNISGNQVSLVTSSAEHQDVLVNWLAAAMLVANPPLENVLVLSLDETLYHFLTERMIQSLYVSPEMVIDSHAKIDKVFSQVHIVRLTVLRLINHYGFDVVNYDCDAIVLKNPDPLFEKYKAADMIGTFGKGPSQLFNKWGITLNTGVLLLRSTSRMEYFWEAMSSLKHSTTDDQGNINLVLDELDVKWTNLNPKDNIDNTHYDVHGIGRHRLNVVLLSFDVICRHTCNPLYRDSYYVWHALAIKENRTVENKIEQARVGNAWLLHLDWLNKGHNLTGLEWLNSIIIN